MIFFTAGAHLPLPIAQHPFSVNSLAFGLAILPGMIYYLIELTIDSIIAQRWHENTPDTIDASCQVNAECCATRSAG